MFSRCRSSEISRPHLCDAWYLWYGFRGWTWFCKATSWGVQFQWGFCAPNDTLNRVRFGCSLKYCIISSSLGFKVTHAPYAFWDCFMCILVILLSCMFPWQLGPLGTLNCFLWESAPPCLGVSLVFLNYMMIVVILNLILHIFSSSGCCFFFCANPFDKRIVLG